MNEGMVPVVKPGGRIAYVDGQGNAVLTLDSVGGKEVAHSAAIVKEGMVWIWSEDNRFGYLDTKGEVIIPPECNDVNPYVDGLTVVIEGTPDGKGGAYVAMDKKGNVAFRIAEGLTPKFVFVDGLLAAASTDGGYVLIDESGEIKYRLPEAKDILEYDRKYAVCSCEGGVAALTLEGKTVIAPGAYESIQLIGDDRFLAYRDGKSVVVMSDGRVAHELEGRVVYDRRFGLVRAADGSKVEYDGLFGLAEIKGAGEILAADGSWRPFAAIGPFGVKPISIIDSDYKK